MENTLSEAAAPMHSMYDLESVVDIPNEHHEDHGGELSSSPNPNPSDRAAMGSMPSAHHPTMDSSAKSESPAARVQLKRVEGRPETTIHTWVALAATEKGQGVSVCRLLSVLSVSLAFLALKCFLMLMVVRESSYPRCTSHDECPAGNWCTPAYPFNNPPSLEYPGICHDCFTTNRTEFQDDTHPPAEWWTTKMDDWFTKGALHCGETDTMPNHCDHLARNLHRMSGGVFLVLLCCIGVILQAMVEDVNQSHVEIAILWRRTRRSFGDRSKKRILLKVFCLLTMRIRVFVVPVLLAQTTLALVISGELTAQNILLDSVSVTILCNLDHICRHFFIPPPVGRGADDVYADEYTSLVIDATKATELNESPAQENEIAGQGGESSKNTTGGVETTEFPRFAHLSRLVPTPEVRTWILVRMWILLIGVAIFVQMLGLETWMKMWGGESAGGTRAVCSDIATIGEIFSSDFLYIAIAVFEVCRLIENCLRGRRGMRRLCTWFFIALFMDALVCFSVYQCYVCAKRLHSGTIVHGF